MVRFILSDIFWCCAVFVSIIWAIYGWLWAIKEKDKITPEWLNNFGVSLSDYLGSFFGFCCIRLLARRLQLTGTSFGIFEVILLIIAFIGVTGYTYQIGAILDKYSK